MSALQVRWLTEHLSQGKITREEFASLYARVTTANRAANEEQDGAQHKKVLRLHPMTRRILIQIRAFKTVARGAKILLFIGLVIASYYAWQIYQSDDMTMAQFGKSTINALLSGTIAKPLPEDFQAAARFLSGQNNWALMHVNEFTARWAALDVTTQEQYKKSEWFRSFSLALALQIADQHALAKNGDVGALRRHEELVKLANMIELPPAAVS
ncbi:MAG: hypothetical protein PVG89_17315 [Gammaproteobacteria bacterium]|jgi:hypothetical protein